MKKAIFLVGMLSLVFSCKQEFGKAAEAKKNTAKKVRVTDLNDQGSTDLIIATGTLASKEEVILSFKTGGIVNRLNFEEGNKVKKGERLASLNLSEIDAQLKSAQNAYDKSVRDYERATQLYKDTVGTLEQQQNAETGRDIAKSNLEIANFNRRYSLIKAPVKGTVLKRFVEEGQLVSPGQPIFLVGSSDTKGAQIIKIGLTDKDVVKVNLKDTASIVFDAFPKTGYQGKVTEIAQAANAKTGLYDVEVNLGDYHPELKNGFVGRLQIMPQAGDTVLKIPMNALVEGKNRSATIFYTLDLKTVKAEKVEILELKDNHFTIKSDALPSYAKVINEGAPFLRVNDSIQILR
ncbi:MAG: efflux RND transporter periplasmic adaptor subunit [Saonia sp.]